LEKKIAVVFGFDKTYYEYIKKDDDSTFCPNGFYVALTRASEILIAGLTAGMAFFLGISDDEDDEGGEVGEFSVTGVDVSVEDVFSGLCDPLPLTSFDIRSPAAPIKSLAASDPKPQTR
jgi:hypothetical protein